MKLLLVFIALMGIVGLRADARACFQSRTELVANATVIAIIELEEPKVADVKTSEKTIDPFADPSVTAKWTYSTQAKATLVTLIKGNISKDFVLFGGESFICAQCTLAKGRYLAFLRKDADYWVGSNWQLSLRPIKGKEVEWYVSDGQIFPMKPRALGEVLHQVRADIAKNKSSESNSPK